MGFDERRNCFRRAVSHNSRHGNRQIKTADRSLDGRRLLRSYNFFLYTIGGSRYDRQTSLVRLGKVVNRERMECSV
jgi:hypothetical protein